MTPWQIPKMWEGGECWIIGGGPSIYNEFGIPEDVVDGVLTEKLPISAYSPFLSPIHDKHVIGINTAFLIGDWIDIVFFGDGGFYFQNKTALDRYPKVKISSSPHIIKKSPYDMKYVPRNASHREGISTKPNTVSWNLNSGAASISVAYHLGVKRIYLLGFDMYAGETGNQHWHRHYMAPGIVKDLKKVPFRRHLPSFPHIANDAKSLKVKIINVSQNSKITVFEKKTIQEILG